MEALAALGVAGNVVQFVQFAGQLISEVKEIRSEEGSPKSFQALHQISKSATKQAEVIEARLEAQTHTLSQEEQVGRKTSGDVADFLSMSWNPLPPVRRLAESFWVTWKHSSTNGRLRVCSTVSKRVSDFA
jgi:hypothetical protein